MTGGRHTVRTLPQEVWSVWAWRDAVIGVNLPVPSLARASLGLVNVATIASGLTQPPTEREQ